MWAVRDDFQTYYYNKKENAANKAKKFFTNFIKNNYESIEKYNECCWGDDYTYNKIIKAIEKGKCFFDEVVDIYEIETED